MLMKLTIDGAEVEVDDRHARTPLLWVLRDVLGMHGTKFGCGVGYCAACTVLLDGKNTKSCQTATERAVGKSIVTVEGASGPVVDAIRDAWYRGNVVQCGYCQPGQSLAPSTTPTRSRISRLKPPTLPPKCRSWSGVPSAIRIPSSHASLLSTNWQSQLAATPSIFGAIFSRTIRARCAPSSSQRNVLRGDHRFP